MSYDPSKPALVPEHVLRKKANLDRLAAARSDRLSRNGNRKVFSKSSGAAKVRKPETYLAKEKGKLNAARRFERVKKKGLQGRKRRQGEAKTKVVDKSSGQEVTSDDEVDEADTELVEVKANSLGAPTVFVVRMR